MSVNVITESQNKAIINLADMLEGEINRMCVTSDVTEYVAMYEYAKRNLDSLFKLIFESKFKNRG